MKAIMRTGKVKTWGHVAAMSGHHDRSRETPNADPTKTRLNKVLVGSGNPDADLRQRYADAGITEFRKNGVLAIEVLATASPEFFRPKNPDKAGTWSIKLKPWVDANLVWARETFGAENVVGAVLHLDEATPHIHFTVAPIDDEPRAKGPAVRQNAARWLDGPARLSQLQETYGAAMQPFGLERGLKGSKATHTTVKQYYGGLSLPDESVKAPTVQTPPLALTEKGRGEWAKAETKRIRSEQKPAAVAVNKKAKHAGMAERKRKEAVATAEAIAEERDRLKEVANKVRDIDLVTVAERLGLEKDPVDRKKWKGFGCHISLNGSRFFDHDREVGGGGAIDLAKHVLDCDFKAAVRWLSDGWGMDAAAGAVAARAAETVKEAAAEPPPFHPPAPAARWWARVRDYLVNTRCLGGRLVDLVHRKGLVYADERANVVMRGRQAAELRGTGEERFQGLAAGSRRDGGGLRLRLGEPERLVVVESGIDALSFFEREYRRGERDIEVVSMTGVRSRAPFIDDAIALGRKVVCAFDADDKGDEFANKMREAYPEAHIVRRRPPKGKDWNDTLRIEKGESESPSMDLSQRLDQWLAKQEADAEDTFNPSP